MPLVRLLNTHIQGQPGHVFRAFGHDFVVQSDGTATANVDEAFVAAEVRAGRYEVIKDPSKTGPEEFADLDDFGFDSANFFGCKSLKDLQAKLKSLKKESLIAFAASRLKINMPMTIDRTEVFADIMNAIQKINADNDKKKDKK